MYSFFDLPRELLGKITKTSTIRYSLSCTCKKLYCDRDPLIKCLDESVRFSYNSLISECFDKIEPTNTIFETAAINGNGYYINFSIQNGFLEVGSYCYNKILELLAEHNHLDKIKSVLSEHFPHQILRPLSDGAAKGGNIEIYCWLKDNVGINITHENYYLAAKYGHFNYLKFLLSEDISTGLNCFRSNTCEFALNCIDGVIDSVNQNNLEILEWAIDNGFPCQKIPINSGKNVNVLMWFINRGYELCEELWYNSLNDRRLDSLKLLHFYRCPQCRCSLNHAASYGHLNVMKFLISIGYVVDESVILASTIGSYSGIINFLRSMGHIL